MPDDVPTAPPPSRHLFRWLLVALGVLILPVLIFVATRAVFFHVMRPASASPSAVKLRTIGQALRRYAQDHGGTYPKSLAELARDQRLPDDLPTVPTTAPGGPYDYAYLGAGRAEQTTPNGTVIAYEPLAANGGRGSQVLYADGSDTWIIAADLRQELDRDQRSGPPPE